MTSRAERIARIRWESRPRVAWNDLASSFRAYLIGCVEDELDGREKDEWERVLRAVPRDPAGSDG